MVEIVSVASRHQLLLQHFEPHPKGDHEGPTSTPHRSRPYKDYGALLNTDSKKLINTLESAPIPIAPRPIFTPSSRIALVGLIVCAILDDRGQVMMQVDVPVIQSSFLHVALADTKKLPLCHKNKQEVKS